MSCYSIRFAPPLVIEEEDLKRAVRIIGECLADLDTVSLIRLFHGVMDPN